MFFLSSCLLGGGREGSRNVSVKVVAFHENSSLRTASGRPYIRRTASQRGEICRWRPFELRDVRSQLLKEGIDEEVLDEYLLHREEGTEEEEGAERETREPVYMSTGENWIKFGLQIINFSPYVLIIHTVSFNAKARCGSQIFEHSGEINTGYCSVQGDNAPYLYIVPPTKYNDRREPIGPMVHYRPLSSNAFDNLTLILDGFPIVDRTREPSKSLQNAFQTNTSPSTTAGAGAPAAALAVERECQPDKTIVIPRYTIELTLIGYYLLPKAAEEVSYFTKTVSFPTAVINL